MVEREITPRLEKNDANRALPKSEFMHILGKFAEMGLTAARLPESGGGPGMKLLDYGIMIEQIPPSVALVLIAHEASTARFFAESNDAQKSRFLPDLIAGKKMFCTGSTEPDTGSDPRGIKTRVKRDGDRLVLNGRKMWISNVAECDLMLVTCLDENNKVVKVIIDRAASPFDARNIDTIGLRQGMLGEAVFDNCRLPAENLIIAPAGGTEILKSSWAVNRPLFGLLSAHLAQRAYDMALEYAKTRKQFGKPIAAHQLVQKNLSDMHTAIVTSRLLSYYALSRADAGQASEGDAAMAKRYAQNACRAAVWEAMNIFGAMGLSTEAKIEALYRDIRMIPIPDGTNEILALIHGRDITGMEAFRGVAPSK